MALPNVKSGDPHVAAHNDERAQINLLLSNVGGSTPADATVTTKGVIELATAAEATTTDAVRAITPATLRSAAIDLVFAKCGVKPVLKWTGTAWPNRTTSMAVSSGYTGPITWDSSTDTAAPAPSTSVPGDEWLRRTA